MPQSQLFASSTAASRAEAKKQFGRTLQRYMAEKGWNQSVLARRAGLGRDAISTYVRGISFPEPHNLHKIAVALGLEIETLLPGASTTAVAVPGDVSAFEMRQLDSAGERFLIHFRRIVGKDTAAEIMRLLANDDTDDPSAAT